MTKNIEFSECVQKLNFSQQSDTYKILKELLENQKQK